MTEAVNPAGQAAPAASNPPSPAAGAAPPSAPSAGTSNEEPTWLPGRLERERETTRKALLRELGVEDVKDAKSAISDLKKRQEAEKTETQRISEELAAVKAKAGLVDELAGVVKARAEIELKSLTDEQRAAVAALAGDDPAKQLRTIDALKSTWAKPATTSGPAPLPPPASTTAAATAPQPTTPPEQVDHAAVYDEINKSNPMLAAHYLTLHGPAVFAARKKRT